MVLKVCLDYAHFIPQGLRPVACSYRSLFTFIDYKLLEKSLSTMKYMSYDLQADGEGSADQ